MSRTVCRQRNAGRRNRTDPGSIASGAGYLVPFGIRRFGTVRPATLRIRLIVEIDGGSICSSSNSQAIICALTNVPAASSRRRISMIRVRRSSSHAPGS